MLLHDYSLQKTKLASPHGSVIFGPIVLTKDIAPHHDWLKMTKPRFFFVTYCPCHKKAEFSEFQQIALQGKVSRPFCSTKKKKETCNALRRSRLHFLGCRTEYAQYELRAS